MRFPSWLQRRKKWKRGLRNEEERFGETLVQGMRILQEDIEHMSSDTISGDTVFKLYDTYGFPVDLTADIAREKNLQIDRAGFERNMQQQRERARDASRFGGDYDAALDVKSASDFCGYQALQGDTEISEIFVANQPVEHIQQDQAGILVLSTTPFYAESGGQLGDTGTIAADGFVFTVSDTQKKGNAHAHIGTVTQGRITTGSQVPRPGR